MYTVAFYETWELIGKIALLDHSAVQDLAARIDCSDYTEIEIIILSEAGSGNTIDIDVEEADALTAGTLQGFGGGTDKDVTIADADFYTQIRLRSAEFSEGFRYLNVECTPSAARMFAVAILGKPKSRPASLTLVDNNVD